MIARTRQWLTERVDGRRQGTTLLLAVLLLGVLGWTWWDRNQSDVQAEQAGEQRQLAEDNARQIAGEVRDACQRQGEVAVLLGDLCRQAQEVAEQPTEQVLVPPSDEQLRPLVQQYVAAWLARNPPRDGRDGMTPSVETISRLIAAELAENPPRDGQDGEDGEDGEDGRTPTAAELQPIVAAAVEAFLEANPPPAGEDGADSTVPGPPGEPPLEWTFTTTDVAGRETTHRCVREEQFDPDAPRYECKPVEDEEDEEP